MSDTTYKSAGVDLDLYQQAMARLPALMARTHAPHRSRVIDLPGGFAGLFRLNADRRRYDDPVLVSGTDGVGTKLKVAQAAGVYNTIGIDLVAMCVNDVLCLGAEPLFFLDYLALSQDDPDLIGELVAGVSEGCLRAKAALLGGETAIMPGVYAPGDFDMAGFCVGVAERTGLIDGEAIQPGDVLIGIASSGFHSNGYSLIRKVVFETAGLGLDQLVPGMQQTVGDVLLKPTRIYTVPVLDLMSRYPDKIVVTGMAHVTGGGLAENVARMLPEGRRARVDRAAWDVPPMFTWLAELGRIDREEMHRVFNMGIGLVLVVRPELADDIQHRLARQEIRSWSIGEIVEGERGVDVTG